MIIWTGWGFLVFVIGFGFALITQWLLSSLLGNEESWMAALGYLLSALVIWFVGKKLNSNTNKTRLHTFFFIPFEYWAIGAVLIAIGTYFTQY
ncbi:hypothetical protein HY468_01525 [Candidatus Roizmanbacteria bacterium]|nr:hypothetical protein [Candidatus Roizmanbacteria bacterium]